MRRNKTVKSRISQIFLRIFLSGLLFWLSPAHAYSVYSTQELEDLEKEFVQLINRSSSVERHPLAKRYIKGLASRLSVASKQPLPDFFIVKSSEVNAFAGPGGHIGLNTQLILTADDEDELASVMAHEMAHVRLHHLYYMIDHQKQMQIPKLASILASVALGLINPVLGTAGMYAALTGFAQDDINFVRSNEKAADRIGIDMLIKAGFNPIGMVNFFKKMDAKRRFSYTTNIPPILLTHPLDHDRMAEAMNRISRTKVKIKPQSSQFYFFQALILSLTNHDPKTRLDEYKVLCQSSSHPSACFYGHGLTLIQSHQYQKAKTLLEKLTMKEPDNFYLQSALAEAELKLGENKQGLSRLKQAYQLSPDNDATILLYAVALLEANQPQEARSILLKGSRNYPKDLSMCYSLALSESKTGNKPYAYFTQSNCMLLEGRHRRAMTLLEEAKKLAQGNKYLLARIDAKMDEIKSLIQKD